MKVSFDELKEAIKNALLNNKVNEEDAELMAEIHAVSTLKGVNSHGLNRIPRLIDFLDDGWVDRDGQFELVKKFGAIENYEGNLGFGVLNAIKATDRVVELASEHGIAMVSLKNTTHWMRGGTYAERIAEKGFVGMVWTNTESIMPVWGSDEVSTGNNPIGIGIPSKSGNIALDMAISQYSFGKIESTKLAGEMLPFPGGYNKEGELSVDPKEVEEGKEYFYRLLEGSGLAIALDTMAALLANGKAGVDIDNSGKWNCTGCSQIFIAINPLAFSTEEENEEIISKIKAKVNDANPIVPGRKPRYPGQGMMERMAYNEENGITVDDGIWSKVLELGK